MPAPIVINIPTEADLPRAAKEFLRAIGERRVVALHGAMGAGKTTFVRAVCNALQISDTVNSPTFAIVNEYVDGNGEPVYHFDFYRIKNLREACDIGCEEYFYSGYPCFIEWPELVEELLPEDTISVHVEVLENEARRITVG